MYLRKAEKIYLITFLLSIIAMVLFSVTTTVFGFIEVIKTDAILDNVLESFLMIICFIFLGLAIMFAIEALHKRKGSYIMKTLTIDPETGKGKKSARIITLTLGILGLAAGIYFSLSYFGLPVYVFHFPIMLVTCMMNWGYMIAIIGIYFFFYPEIYIKAYSY